MFRSKSKLAVLVAAVGGVGVMALAFIGCAGTHAGCCGMDMTNSHCSSNATAASPAKIDPPANAYCPIMGGKIDPQKVTPALTRQFNGRTIAFCCGGCPSQWDKLDDAQKQAKLDKQAAH